MSCYSQYFPIEFYHLLLSVCFFIKSIVKSRRVTRKGDGMRISDHRWRKMHLLHSAVRYLPAATILSLRGGAADVAISCSVVSRQWSGRKCHPFFRSPPSAIRLSAIRRLLSALCKPFSALRYLQAIFRHQLIHS
jgi:hypothetical protein